MRKTVILLLLIIIPGILLSCDTSEKDSSFRNMDSKSFFEYVTLPERLSIDINLDEIRNIDEAKTFKADYINFNKQELIKAFVKNSITEEKILAEGPQIIASDGKINEILSIYDGGKSFGTENSMKGGFTYIRVNDGIYWEKLDTIANISFTDPSFIEQKYGYNLNNDYASYSDLDFLPFEKAIVNIKKIFDIAGIPPFDIYETHSLDLETILSHYKLYLHSESVEDDKKNINWTKDDECYIFSLRQLIDNIPVVNKGWQMPDGAKGSVWGNPMPSTEINLVYDKTGISRIAAYNILSVTDEIENNSLINVYEALNILIEDYSRMILEEDTRIISAELCYLSIPKDNMVELVPGWIFGSVKATELNGSMYNRYKYDAINAVTGQLYPDRW
ncbi:hypothetical protein [Mahella sp.]|uniref:hypothetical protein n=1 Tax=Mahella sp. TaxID=2798721 RepID=UPI0025BFDD41|nr:hypothetical protein [Mahella sp.]MBZ4665361.1 hypothetical protein [Mahella sp.]